MIRVLVTVVGLLALAVAAVGFVARYLSISNEVLLVVAAASPYLCATGVAAMVLFAVARRWVPRCHGTGTISPGFSILRERRESPRA